MKPVLQALVLAEHVYEDRSGKKIICGTFNRLTLKPKRSGPPEHDVRGRPLVDGGGMGAPWVYLSLTDVCDQTTISLQFVSLTVNEVLFETEILLSVKSRLSTVEIVAPLPHLLHHLVGPGLYAFEVVCDGEIIGSHRITTVIAPGDDKGDDT